MKVYSRWTEVPASEWRWPSFSPEEVACRGTGRVAFEPAAMDRLQALRDRLAVPVILNSAYRSPEHNKAVGGAKASRHLVAEAFDVSMANHDPAAFEAAARAVGFTGFGFYPRSNFIHVDIGPAREWGTRWPVVRTGAPTRFSEPEVKAETPEADKVVKGLVAAVAGAMAAVPAVVESVGKLSPLAQGMAVGGGFVLLAALAYLARDRIRAWRL